MTAGWKVAGIGRFRYGSSALWTVHGDLTGSSARRFAGTVDLFFRSGETSLLVDLREASLVDSAGATALARCRGAYPGFQVVGRPAIWIDLPPVVRRTLVKLEPEPDLETALTAATAPDRSDWPQQRRHARIPLQLPVELFRAGRMTTASLRDIGRGGVGLALLPKDWLQALLEDGAEPTFGILGIEADPLGREIIARLPPGPVSVVPVYEFAGSGLGARYSDNPPPT